MRRASNFWLAALLVGILGALGWRAIDPSADALLVAQADTPAADAPATDAAPTTPPETPAPNPNDAPAGGTVSADTAPPEELASSGHAIKLWEPLTSDKYATYEKVALLVNVAVAIAGLVYALMLVRQVVDAPKGTQRMQDIAKAIREGANAYLFRQFRVAEEHLL